MNIFVTGGAGYIGPILRDHFLRSGHSVTVYDSLISGNRAALPGEARFIHADLGDLVALRDALASDKYDAVIHLAGSVDARESMLNPSAYFDNNVSKSLGLLGAVTAAGVQRFIFASTYSIYQSNGEIHAEDSPTAPQNVYAHTKLAVEQALEWYRTIHGLGVGILRFSNVAGATATHGEARPHETRIIPCILSVALGQRPDIKVYGQDFPTKDGTAIRDFVHVSDVAAANLLVAEKLSPGDFLRYNVSNGVGSTINELIETAREITGHPIPSKVVNRNLGDPPGLMASSIRIQKHLGWQPKYPDLREIVQSAWDWQRTHPNGYRT